MKEGKIPLSLLGYFIDQLKKIAEGTLRLYVEGNSISKKGRLPDWLNASLNFELTGLKKGSTILQIDAPLLKETLKQIQVPLFYDVEAKEVMENTAFSLAMLAYEKAFEDSRSTFLLDKNLLKEMTNFNKVLINNDCKINFGTKNSDKIVTLDKQSFSKIKQLEETTPQSTKMRISGKLDEMKHSNAQLKIITEKGLIKAILSHDLTFENIKPLFGELVSVIGEVNFNPANQITSITVQHIEKAKEGDNYFTKIGTVIKEKTDIKQLISEQNYTGFDKNQFLQLADELQIDESVDDLIKMLTA